MLLRDLTPDLLPPRAALLAGNVVLLTLAPGGSMPAELAPPYGTVAVEGPDGAQLIAAIRLPEGGAGSAWFDALAAMAGLGEAVGDLFAGLNLGSRHRLLGFLLG
ncbi:MAG: hypothetical protein ACRYGM_05910, partial [Janthinobacterium lividum]